jgi:hypothetical protein
MIANVSVQALSPVGQETEYAYIGNQRVATLNLTPSFQNFTFVIGIQKGFNYMFFVPSSENQSAYPIGIANLTVQGIS